MVKEELEYEPGRKKQTGENRSVHKYTAPASFCGEQAGAFSPSIRRSHMEAEFRNNKSRVENTSDKRQTPGRRKSLAKTKAAQIR